jgi:hypothetical protein
VGSLQSGFPYLDRYGKDLGALTFPADGAKANAYPLYDRWAETFNTTTEAVVVDQSRSLATMAFLLARKPGKEQAWRCASARITARPRELTRGAEARFALVAEGFDLSRARIVWEATDAEPLVGPEPKFKPTRPGRWLVEAEAALPDGRRVFATTNFWVSPE